jgi:hypothetical protein
MPHISISVLSPEVHSYIDAARVWLRNPLSDSDLAWLRERAGGRKMHVQERPARINFNFVQRITLLQPMREALEWLSRRNDVLLNFAELSLDWVFASKGDRIAAFRATACTLVKQHHRAQGIRFVGEGDNVTLYTGPRTAPNVIVVYADRPSKATGDPCLHLEWRAKGAAALRSAGIHAIRDLLDFDHRQFWRDRLILCELNRRGLGRRYNNWTRKSRRRGPWVIRYAGGFSYDVDLRAGSIIARACGTTQGVIDHCGKHFNVRPCLTRITDIDHLLPAPP